MSRVVHFEIQASQPQTLIDFSSGLFGWSFTKWEGPARHWLIETGPSDTPGINGGLLPQPGPNGGDATSQCLRMYGGDYIFGEVSGSKHRSWRHGRSSKDAHSRCWLACVRQASGWSYFRAHAA
jgi:hypothetical protein